MSDEKRAIPIIADEYVDMEFGTGALKITPGHDPNDYAIGKKFDLPIINIMNKDGSMNSNTGKNYDGLDRFDARAKLWEDMEKDGLVIKVSSTFFGCVDSFCVVLFSILLILECVCFFSRLNHTLNAFQDLNVEGKSLNLL